MSVSRAKSYTYKIANKESEFEKIFRLNYETFVEEIPQHERNESRRLVDKFHDENLYLICLQGDELMGMLAARDKRPFSLDAKIPDLDRYIPPDRNPVEVRLLSVVPGARSGIVLRGLFEFLIEQIKLYGWDSAVISGTTRQQRLYHRMGFTDFGPLVGTEGAYYQPMFIKVENFEKSMSRIASSSSDRDPVSFLPGPVAIPKEVHDAFSKPPISHRSPEFHNELNECRRKLCDLTRAKYSLVALGSGTLANEMIGAHLGKRNKKGLILANGEFGERLIDQSARTGLKSDNISLDWGQPFDLDSLDEDLAKGYDWLWLVACETSTGMVNDLDEIGRLCKKHDVKLCADCVSAVGAYPLDLSNLYMASGTAGKSLASYAGIALVFYNHIIEPDDRLPKYLDIGYYSKKESVPFTLSSNLLSALNVALDRFADEEKCFAEIRNLSDKVRKGLEEAGLSVFLDKEVMSPAVFTVTLPDDMDSVKFARKLRREGILIASESEYLVKRNWIQVCLMGVPDEKDVDQLLKAMSR